MSGILRRLVALHAAASFLVLGSLAPAARAEQLVSTAQALAESRADATRAQLHALADRPEIAAELARQGLEPEQARASIDALSDAELAAIAGKLEEQPAGAWFGAVLAAGLIVFLVLLFTDIIGATDVFPWAGPPPR
jgi:hypothetical protein